MDERFYHPQKYRKMPVTIEAIQFLNGNGANTIRECEEFIGDKCSTKDGGETLQIHTLEGVMTVHDFDWIIKGVNGEFYPVKSDIFKKTYEPVKD